jgi:HK97 family phage prohead protease
VTPLETRAAHMEVRETQAGVQFRGYASVFERPYEAGDKFGTWMETVKVGAFRRTLGENPDVPLLANHEGLPLARTTSGTLRLSEDAIGLYMDADLDPQDPDVQAVVGKMRRGDLYECSFAFVATAQRWSDDRSERTLDAVSINRGDVSIVNFGANPATTATVRHSEMAIERRESRIAEIGKRVQRRVPITGLAARSSAVTMSPFEAELADRKATEWDAYWRTTGEALASTRGTVAERRSGPLTAAPDAAVERECARMRLREQQAAAQRTEDQLQRRRRERRMRSVGWR